VATEIRPDVAAEGTLVAIVVSDAELTTELVMLNFTLLLAGTSSKLAPVMLTAVPAIPIVGENPVMVGAPVGPTVKFVLLVAEPAGVVTAIGPVVAADGTLVTICVAVDEVTVAAVPLNFTVFWLAAVLNPVP